MPQFPRAVAIHVISTVWVVAAMSIFRMIDTESRRAAASGYVGVAVSGLGIAALGVGIESSRLGRFEFGLATIFMGLTIVAIGATLISRVRRYIGAAVAVWGLAVAVVGIVKMIEPGRGGSAYAVSEGAALTPFGVALMVAGVTVIIGDRRWIGLSVYATGVPLIGWGVVLFVFIAGSGPVNAGFSMAAMGFGLGVALVGYAWFIDNDTLVGWAGIAAGSSLLVYGAMDVASGERSAFGMAVGALGTAASVASIVFVTADRSGRVTAATVRSDSRVQPPRARPRSERHLSLTKRVTRARAYTRAD
ncbi:hypothetical protein [Nocardia sp. NPDC050710]|uniref:hypothetical protein n=1 Tax=Nocardia sp. NPDC050710 TaxID=3157220 RepID=UPI0033DEAA49